MLNIKTLMVLILLLFLCGSAFARMDSTLTQLGAATGMTSADLFYMVDDGTSKKLTWATAASVIRDTIEAQSYQLSGTWEHTDELKVSSGTIIIDAVSLEEHRGAGIHYSGSSVTKNSGSMTTFSSGATTTFANNPTFSSSPVFSGTPSFTGEATVSGDINYTEIYLPNYEPDTLALTNGQVQIQINVRGRYVILQPYSGIGNLISSWVSATAGDVLTFIVDESAADDITFVYNSSNILLSGSVNFTMSGGTAITFYFLSSSKAIEISRMDR